MNSNKLVNWPQIVGNLAILAGLVLVAIEINQNTASIQGAAYQDWVAANMELNMAATEPSLSHLFVLGNVDSKNLSNESFVAFAMWNLGLMQMAQATDFMYRSGSLDRELWEAEINRAAGILSAPGVRQWWDAGGNTQLTPRFVKLLESTQSSMAFWNWDSERGFFRDDELRMPLDEGPDSPTQ